MGNNKVSTLKRSLKRHKKLVITLSAALGVSGVTAIVAPTMVAVLKKGGGGDTPSTTIHTITYNGGQHGTISGQNVQYAKDGSLFSAVNAVTVSANPGYVFSGWLLPDGQTLIDANYPITSDLTLTAKYEARDILVGITFDVSQYAEFGTTVSSSYRTVKSGTTYGELKNSLPIPTNPTEEGQVYEFKYWYYKKDDEGVPIQILDSETFDQNITLYPYFSEESFTIETVSIEFVLIDDQERDPRSIAPLTTTVQYCSAEGHEIQHTFGEIAKPTIVQPGKVFSKWYKKYEDGTFSEEWQTTDPLVSTGSPYKVYAECVTPNTNPIITFTSDEEDITWIGNTQVVVDGTKIEWSKVSKPYVFKDIHGTPASGFTSPWSFGGWYWKDASGTHDLNDTDEITKTITVYPKFAEKPQVLFEMDDKESPTLSDGVAIDPNGVWGDVVPPGAAISETTTNYFMGWGLEKTRIVEDPETGEKKEEKYIDQLLPETGLSGIATNTHIKPIFSDSCNRLHFYENAKVDTGSETVQLQLVRYIGNDLVGTNKNYDVYFNSQVNKPVPQACKKTETETEDIYTFSFSEKWQYNETGDLTTEANWHDITDDYKITKVGEGEDEKDIYIRPILNPTVHITYKDNGGTFKEQTWGTITDVYTKTDVEFENIYRPQVEPPAGKQFLYWATDPDNPTTTKIEQTTKFTTDTTLYAIFDEKDVSSTVYYKLAQKDIDEGATITCESVTQNHKINEQVKFSQIGKATPKLDGYVVDYWTYDEEGEQKVPDDLVLPNNDSITVYAHFALDSRYCKISVKKPTSESEYEIIGTNNVFVETNSLFPVNSTQGAEANLLSDGEIAVNVKKPGYEIVGWQTADGKTIIYHRDTQKVVPTLTTSLENIVPIFAASTRIVTFAALDSDITVKTGTVPTAPITMNYNTNLKDYIDSLGIVLEKSAHEFVGWQYTITSNPGSKVTSIDSTSCLQNDITITPKFVSESEFKWGTEPYYFDSEQSKWAKIKSFDNPEYLEVYYAGGQTANVDKATFDYQVFFGEDCESIPDNFMKGCISWTNKNNKLEIPSRIHSIGDNFLYSCASFNQEITWTTDVQEVEIGKNFMNSCYSFNQNITFGNTFVPTSPSQKPDKLFIIEPGFMFECRAFCKTIDISDYTYMYSETESTSPYWYYTMSSFDKYSAIYQKGFTIKTSADCGAIVESAFPNLKGDGIKPYRTINVDYPK